MLHQSHINKYSAKDRETNCHTARRFHYKFSLATIRSHRLRLFEIGCSGSRERIAMAEAFVDYDNGPNDGNRRQ